MTSSVSPEVSESSKWKRIKALKELKQLLDSSLITHESFTGKIILNFNCGGITSVEKTETFK